MKLYTPNTIYFILLSEAFKKINISDNDLFARLWWILKDKRELKYSAVSWKKFSLLLKVKCEKVLKI